MSNLDETPAAKQIDEDHDEASAPNLWKLPLELYPRIASCLDYVSDDLSNLCTSLQDRVPGIEGNGDIVDKILCGNEEYLRHIVASTNTRSVESVANAKAKILQWMGSNPSWTERCGDLVQASQSVCRFSIHHSNYDKLNLHQYHPGVICFQGYVGTEHTGDLPCEGDLLHSFGCCMLAAECTLDQINENISDVDTSRSPGWTHHFFFLRDVNFIFRHPIAAIAFGLEPVLRHMLERGIVRFSDRYSEMLSLSKTVSLSPDISGFQYLLTLRNLHSRFLGNEINLIHWCAMSSKEFSLGALEMALRHPRAPGINDLDRHGGTALCLVCIVHGIPLKLRHKKLKMLLAYKADPQLGDPLPIDALRKLSHNQIQDATECHKLLYNEMVDLLEGRSASASRFNGISTH